MTESNLLDRKKSIVRLQRPSEMSGISTGQELDQDNERELKRISRHQRRSERSIISITKEDYHTPLPDNRHELTVKDSVIRWSVNPQIL